MSIFEYARINLNGNAKPHMIQIAIDENLDLHTGGRKIIYLLITYLACM